MKTCKQCNFTEEQNGKPFPASYGLLCSICKNGRYRYGLNRLKQIELLKKQNAKCGVCQKELELFVGKENKACAHIDHQSKDSTECYSKWDDSSFVRGILCVECNTKVGNADIKYFKKIIEYLENPPAL